eukprot:CAMPEP_0174236486 /NCGR_PEP_ID=MMETSP0417-20130205/5603_1 /TAXON_ID=242541 /ORGANISM="Mayorella sp, Strain BSH-02190019" /LENGTH=215 /DNA_ID=CAMNT_0015315139 /DNA_START=137 /DNA_END=784 /DNA_ORIENTATION=-
MTTTNKQSGRSLLFGCLTLAVVVLLLALTAVQAVPLNCPTGGRYFQEVDGNDTLVRKSVSIAFEDVGELTYSERLQVNSQQVTVWFRDIAGALPCGADFFAFAQQDRPTHSSGQNTETYSFAGSSLRTGVFRYGLGDRCVEFRRQFFEAALPQSAVYGTSLEISWEDDACSAMRVRSEAVDARYIDLAGSRDGVASLTATLSLVLCCVCACLLAL